MSGYDCKYFQISELQLSLWNAEYEPLGIIAELNKMKNWLDANPRRQKKNYRRFIISWLNKAHAQMLVAAVNAREHYRDAQTGSHGRTPSKEQLEEYERNAANGYRW